MSYIRRCLFCNKKMNLDKINIKDVMIHDGLSGTYYSHIECHEKNENSKSKEQKEKEHNEKEHYDEVLKECGYSFGDHKFDNDDDGWIFPWM